MQVSSDGGQVNKTIMYAQNAAASSYPTMQNIHSAIGEEITVHSNRTFYDPNQLVHQANQFYSQPIQNVYTQLPQNILNNTQIPLISTQTTHPFYDNQQIMPLQKSYTQQLPVVSQPAAIISTIQAASSPIRVNKMQSTITRPSTSTVDEQTTTSPAINCINYAEPYENTSEESDFQPSASARRKRKRGKNASQQKPTKETEITLTTKNRFASLSNAEENMDSHATENENLHVTKIPPFILYNVTSKLPSLINQIKESTSEFTYQLLADNKIKILTRTVESYKTVKNILDENNIERHTYKLPEEKLFRVVLRNLHHSTEPERIIEALSEEGHEVKQIMNVRDRITKSPKNLFFIDLLKKSNNGEIYNIKTLLNAVVRFEAPYNKQTIVQCKRCQNYGHTRNQCTQHFRCVKCAEYHDYRSCKKKKEDGQPAKCVLCGGAHPANYKGCQVYLDILHRRTSPQNQAAQKQKNSTVALPSTSQENRPATAAVRSTSYAQVVAQQPQQNMHNVSTLPNEPILMLLQQQNTFLQQQNIQFQQQIERQQQAIYQLTQEIRLLREEMSRRDLSNNNGCTV